MKMIKTMHVVNLYGVQTTIVSEAFSFARTKKNKK